MGSDGVGEVGGSGVLSEAIGPRGLLLLAIEKAIVVSKCYMLIFLFFGKDDSK